MPRVEPSRNHRGTRRIALRRSPLALALGVAFAWAAGSAGAQQSVVVDTSRTTTVSLPAGAGSAQVNAGVSVTVTTTNGHAITTTTTDTWAVTNLGQLTTSGSNAYGVRFLGAGSVINAGSIQASAYGAYAQGNLVVENRSGAVMRGANGIGGAGALEVTNAGTIDGTSRGILVSLPNLGPGATITNSGLIQGVAAAIETSTGSVATAASTITNLAGGRMLATGATGSGVSLLHGTTLVDNRAQATIQGPASGIRGGDLNTNVDVRNAGTITGGTGPGIWDYGGGTIDNLAGGTISGAGGVAYVRSRFNDGNVLTNAGTITATSTTFTGGTGANAGSGVGVYFGGIYKPAGAFVNNQAGGSILGTAYGVYSGIATLADDSGPLTVTNAGTISGNTGIAFNTAVGTVVNAGRITGTQGTAISFDQATAFANSLTLDTGSVLSGNVLGGPGVDALILKGTNGDDGARFVRFDTLSMQGTEWTLTGSPAFAASGEIVSGTLHVPGQLTTPALTILPGGTLAGNGVVVSNVTHRGAIAPGASIGALTIRGNYVGDGGSLLIESALAGDGSPSDRLILDGGAASGSTGVLVANDGGAGDVTAGNGILVVDAINGATTAATAFALNDAVVAGPYEYLLYRGSIDGVAPDSWYLRSTIDCNAAGAPVPPCPAPPPPDPTPPDPTPPDPTPPSPPDPTPPTPPDPTPPRPPAPPVPPIPNYRSETSLYAVMPAMPLAYGRRLIGTLHERAGEVRPGIGPSAGRLGWIRAFGLEGDREGDRAGIYGTGPRYDYDMAALQLGIDLLREEGADRRGRQAGVYLAGGRMKADVTHYDGRAGGDDRLDAYSIGGYWTQYAMNGAYFDAVLQATRNEVEASSFRLPDVRTTGMSYAASLEAGYPFALQQAWWIEPQIQVVYQTGSLDDARETLPSGRIVTVRFDDIDSFTARLGVRFAREFGGDAGRRPITAWIRPNLWHEFRGEPRTEFSSATGFVPFAASLKGTWTELNIGVDAPLSSRADLVFNGGYQYGADDPGHAWNAQLEVRVAW